VDAACDDASRYAQRLEVACRSLAFDARNASAVQVAALTLLTTLLSCGAAPLPPGVSSTLRLGELSRLLRARVYTDATKAGGGVRAALLRALGALAERYSDVVASAPPPSAAAPRFVEQNVPLPTWLRKYARTELARQLEAPGAKGTENLVVAGALDALAAVLATLPSGALPDAEAREIFRLVVVVLRNADATRYDPMKAALRLLARHCVPHFQEPLLRSPADLDAVVDCRLHANPDVKEAAKPALDAALDALAAAMADTTHDVTLRHAAFTTCWQTAEKLLKMDGEGSRTATVALRAIGALAPAAASVSATPGAELARVGAALRHYASLATPDDYRGLNLGTERALALLDAYSRLAGAGRTGGAIGAADVDFALDAVCDAATWLVAHYPALSQRQRGDVRTALARTMLSLARAGAANASSGQLPQFLERCVRPWLLAALDSAPASPAALLDLNTGADAIAAGAPMWPHYVPLWKALLTPPPACDAADDAAASPARALFDALATAVLQLVTTDLDLRVTRKRAAPTLATPAAPAAPAAAAAAAAAPPPPPPAEGGDGDGDDAAPAAADAAEDDALGEGLVAVQPEDVVAFARLSGLFGALLAAAPPHAVAQWTPPLARALVEGARASPAVPGFYTLLTRLLGAAEAAGFFAADALAEHAPLLALLSDVVAECGARARQAQGDLRDALLSFVLAAPLPVAPPGVVGPAAGAALRLGVSTPSLAAAALSALERLQAHAPHALAPLLPHVVPSMAPLIEEAARREAGGATAADEAVAAATGAAAAAAPGAGGARGRETAARAARAAARGAAAARAGLSRDEDVIAAAGRAQRLLGLFGAAAHAMVEAPAAGGDENGGASGASGGGGAWDPERRVSMRFGLSSATQVEFFLDGILPRAAFLATSSPDRRSKVAACELLHAVTILLVGREAGMRSGAAPASGAPPASSGFDRIYEALFPVLLRLSADAERVAEQLFGPLSSQLARWLGHTGAREGADVRAFLDALMAGAADEEHGALRERCALLAGELFDWALRQRAQQLASGGAPATEHTLPSAGRSLLTRCFAALAHPSAWRRRGGAAALARVAKLLRSRAHRAIAEEYALDALARCLDALSRSVGDPPGVGADDMARLAAQRFSLLVYERAGGLRKQLPAFVASMWESSARRELPARVEAQRCFAQLLPRLHGAPTPRAWLTGVYAPGVAPEALAGRFGARAVAPDAPPADAERWLARAEATLQWAAWALERGIFTPSELRDATSASSADAAGGSAERVDPPGAVARLALSRVLHPPGAPPAPSAARSAAALRLLVLLAADLRSPAADAGALTAALCADADGLAAMLRLLTLSLFRPAALGVGAERPATGRELGLAAAYVLRDAAAHARGALLTAFKARLTELFDSEQAARAFGAAAMGHGVDLPQGVDPATVNLTAPGGAAAAASLIDGYNALAEAGALTSVLPSAGPQSRGALPGRLAAVAHALGSDATPTQVQVARSCLQLARRLGLPAGPVLSLLLDTSPAAGRTGAATRGERFWDRFQDELVKGVLLFEPNASVPRLLAAIAAAAAAPAGGAPPAEAAAAAHLAARALEAALDAARVAATLSRAAAAPAGRSVLPPSLEASVFLSALSTHLPLLAPLLTQPDAPPRRTLLNVLGRALDLDALCNTRIMLRPASCAFVLDVYVWLLKPFAPPADGRLAEHSVAEDPSVSSAALALLPYIAELPPADAAPVFSALDDLVQRCVPLSGAAALARGNAQRPLYIALRAALLSALAAVARAGAEHAVERVMRASSNMLLWDCRYASVQAAMRDVADACWRGAKEAQRAAVADQLAGAAMEQLLTPHMRVDFPTAAVDAVLTPLLCNRRTPDGYAQAFFCRHVEALVKLVNNHAAPPPGASGNVIEAKRTAAYRLLELLYMHCSPPALTAVAAEYAAKSGGKRLTVELTKAMTHEMKAATVARGAPPDVPGAPAQQAFLACGAAAFAAFATLLAATQSAERKAPEQDAPLKASALEVYVTRLLRGEFFANASWAAVVDCRSEVQCGVEVERKERALPARAAGGAPGGGGGGATRTLRLQASMGSMLCSSQTQGAAEPTSAAAAVPGPATFSTDGASLMATDAAPLPSEGASGPSGAAADAEEDAADDEEEIVAVDLLDRGPTLNALVRLMEHCARAFGAELLEAASTGDASDGPPLPGWLAPLRDALRGDTPLAPPNASLFVAKAFLRVHARAMEAKEAKEAKRARVAAAALRAGASADEAAAAAEAAASLDAGTYGGSLSLAGATQGMDWDASGAGPVHTPAAFKTQAAIDASRALARRRRPRVNLPELFAPSLAPHLVAVHTRPDAPGGRKLHDVLRQTCWALMDWQPLWESATTRGQHAGELRAAFGRLADHVATVTLAHPKKFIKENTQLMQLLLRRMAPAWGDVAAAHPAREPAIAEALMHKVSLANSRLPAEDVERRSAALSLLASVMTPFEGLRQPLAWDVSRADTLAERIVAVDIPKPTSGAVGHKRLYTLAGEVLGLELARCAADGTPLDAAWAQELWKKLLQLLVGAVAVFAFIMSALCFHYPAAAARYATLLAETLPRTLGDVRWAALDVLTAAAGPHGGADCGALWEALCASLASLTGGSADAGADLRLLKLLKALFIAPGRNDGWDRAAAAASALPTLSAAFTRHRDAGVRRVYFALLRDLADTKHDALLAAPALRESLIAALADADSTASRDALAWWDAQLPHDNLSARLLSLLRACYAGTAADWPRAAAMLLLQLPSHNAALYGESFFLNSPLDRSMTFFQASIDTSWGGASLPVGFGTLGGDTMASQGMGGSLAMGGGTQGGTQGTLASQAWAAAAGAGGGGASQALSASQQALPSWLRVVLPSATQAAGGAAPGGAPAGGAASQQLDASASSSLPHRRLMRGYGAPSAGGGRRVNAADAREELLRAEARRASHDVTLLRDYTIGDFPDVVSLKRADIVRPLAALAARDARIAAAALAALAGAAWREADAGTADAQRELRVSLAAALTEPAAPVPALVASLHALVLEDTQQPGASALVKPEPLARVSRAAGQLAGAVLVVENALLFGAQPPPGAPPAAKRRRASGGGAAPGSAANAAADAEAWRALGGLLCAGGDDAVALSVLEHVAGGADEPQCVALRAQLAGDADAAREAYDDAIADADAARDDGDGDEEDERALVANIAAWRRERLGLLQDMGQWQAVFDDVQSSLDELGGETRLPALWAARDEDAQALMPAYVRAALRLQRPDLVRELASALAQAHPAQRGSFEAAFGVELAALEATAHPPAEDAAARLLSVAARAARAAWIAAPPGATRLRHTLVAALQPQSELSQTLDIVGTMRRANAGAHASGSADMDADTGAPASSSSEDAVRNMLTQWRGHWPSRAFAPPSCLEAVAASRQLCCDSLDAGAAAHGAAAVVAVTAPLRQELARAAGNAARRVGAFALADSLLQAEQRAPTAPFDLGADKARLKVFLSRADAAGGAGGALRDEQLGELREALLARPLRELHALAAAHAEQLATRLDWTRDVRALQGAFNLRLARLRGEQHDGGQQHGELAFHALREAVQLSSEQHDNSAVDGARAARRAARDLLRLGMLCHEALTALDDEAEAGGDLSGPGELSAATAREVVSAAGGDGATAATVVASVLRAAALAGLPDARSALPSVLALLGRHGAACDAFAAHAPAVPLWQLLPWAPQMLAFLSGPEGDALLPTLRALAAAYPRALHFPIALASTDGPGTARVRALAPLAASRAADAFARSIEDLGFPHERLKKWQSTLTTVLKTDAATSARVRALVAAMIADVADASAAAARGSGEVNRLFAALAQKHLKATLGAPVNFSALSATALGSFFTAVLNDPKAAQWKAMAKQAYRRVETMSSTLAAWRDDPSDPVEVPGQYAAAEARGAPPRPEEHVHVVGCDPVMRVLASMQAPVKLTLRVDDGSEAAFLAKNGEDLRQDERILRLFRACATAFAAYAPAAARGLDVITFHVEPLSSRCGLVSWLPHAAPLGEVLKAATPAGALDAIDARYVNWAISKAGGDGSGLVTYLPLQLRSERQLPVAEVVSHMSALHAAVKPPFVLRGAMLAQAGTPERFLACRARYGATLAASCAAGFLVGLGDRHLGNVMLDDATGARACVACLKAMRTTHIA
jgi:DNA-dependent protein kinase catalytic subunit